MSSEEYTMDKFIHHSVYRGGNASEYIQPRGKIDITSHGLGSGIYCLSKIFTEKQPSNKKVYTYEITIENPYTLNSIEQGDNYIKASTNLMTGLESYRNKLYIVPDENVDLADIDLVAQNELFDKLARQFYHDISNTNFSITNIQKSIKDFWHDYIHRTDFVAMPINYIMWTEGIDGVTSLPDNHCHSWSKGNVYYVPYPTYKSGDSLIVPNYIVRLGIKQISHMLYEEYKYNEITNRWVWQMPYY